ncbi:hypothetical protein TSOC_010238 [Tetrabaena socialis]|uniref:Uncharacterized protein n=1 Tax=Tetrabaena socialis TaxID=47790 RepID=A0A2J7ZTW8_9CHLO|nr:hypothetical protein TSOC_010238 [Tetrabaena socialis]|eukprot:PNH03723.1 hypothetical protein TSOC_010238 [Tetrabaena socialis]
MEPIHEDDIHEDEFLFGDTEHDAGTDCPSEDLEDAPAACEAREGHPDAESAEAESSAKSSLIHVTLDAEGGVDAADGSGDRLPSLRSMAASMPVSMGHIRMGSSVPVSIPHMGRWKKSDAAPDSPTTQFAPATFVPPHQLSQVNDFMFSFTGDSPSVAIKRDRLRARNAILKSTGFLEPGVSTVNNIGLQERARLGLAAGGLSQALQQRGSVAAAAATATAAVGL